MITIHTYTAEVMSFAYEGMTAEDITHIHITEAIDDGPAVIRDTGFKATAAIIDEPGGHDKCE